MTIAITSSRSNTGTYLIVSDTLSMLAVLYVIRNQYICIDFTLHYALREA